jgi:hypothetical protein
MNEAPICYPYLLGKLTTKLDFLAYNLQKEGLITHDQVQNIDNFIQAEIAKANADEREYSNKN